MPINASWIAIRFLLALATAAVWATQAHAVSIELKGDAPDRIERQRMAARGQLPLPGTPDVSRLAERLKEKGVSVGNPVMIRAFKAESELEIWMLKGDRFVHFATYPICYWSGSLGPKLEEGDRQTPEGFYTVTRRQLHRFGRHPKSLNLGFPNVFDRSLGRTGSYILVHGACSSVGCYAMTDAVAKEIYRLTSSALYSGQKYVHVHSYPFRMTDENMARRKKSKWLGFWKDLKAGHDAFLETRLPPRITACNGRYQVRHAAPGEAGHDTPLALCDGNVAVAATVSSTRSLAQLDAVVRHRSNWRRLSNGQLRRLKSAYNRFAARQSLRQPKSSSSRRPLSRSKSQSSRSGSQSPTSAKLKATTSRKTGKRLPASAKRKKAKSRPTLKCSLKRASCRRFVALQRAKAKYEASKRAKARNRKSRNVRAKSRRRTASSRSNRRR